MKVTSIGIDLAKNVVSARVNLWSTALPQAKSEGGDWSAQMYTALIEARCPGP
jgi:hypothetical protein